MRRARRSLVVFAVTLAACGDPAQPEDSSPAQLQVVSGSPQSAEVGTALPDPLVVRVVNASGSPIPDAAVQWAVSEGGGTLSSESSSTDPEGLAQVAWTLGTRAGESVATASIGSLRATYAATATPGELATVELSPDRPTLEIGDTLRLAVRLQDRYGNRIPYRPVQWSSSDSTRLGVNSEGRVTARFPGTARVIGTVDGKTAETPVTVRVTWAQVTADGFHSCGLTVRGIAFCWGSNEKGQLGTGRPESSTRPALVSGGFTFESLFAADGRHTCGTIPAGRTLCWGSNNLGQLGDGTTLDRGVPAPALTDVRFSSMMGASFSTCGLTEAGSAHCWGQADGLPVSRTPIAFSNDMLFRSISSSAFITCAVTLERDAFCWGRVRDTYSNLPVAVPGGLKWSMISVGLTHFCGLTEDGSAYCWGNNSNGELGNGTLFPYTSTVTPVAGTHRFETIGVGTGHTCALDTQGKAFCWGNGQSGEVGNGAGIGAHYPSEVVGGHRFTSLGVAREHTCGLVEGGQVYCWGSNNFGQLGRGLGTWSAVPQPVDF